MKRSREEQATNKNKRSPCTICIRACQRLCYPRRPARRVGPARRGARRRGRGFASRRPAPRAAWRTAHGARSGVAPPRVRAAPEPRRKPWGLDVWRCLLVLWWRLRAVGGQKRGGCRGIGRACRARQTLRTTTPPPANPHPGWGRKCPALIFSICGRACGVKCNKSTIGFLCMHVCACFGLQIRRPSIDHVGLASALHPCEEERIRPCTRVANEDSKRMFQHSHVGN